MIVLSKFPKIKNTREVIVIYCNVYSAAIVGVNSVLVNVEADVSGGLPNFSMVGLLSSEVRESRERVRAAIVNTGFEIFSRKITVNLSPADIKKEGAGFDLAIAVSVLCSMGYVSDEKIKDVIIAGELGLDGSVREISGVLLIALVAKEKNIKKIIVPQKNIEEAYIVSDVEIIGVNSLEETVVYLNNPNSDIVGEKVEYNRKRTEYEVDFKDVRGQNNARRAAEIAAAGMHNLLLTGPPGSGKTMIAKRIPTILYSLSESEYLEVAKIYSAMGLINKNLELMERPFREPSNTVTLAAMIGGKANPKPGEITLAHKGVLFLDEFPEFKREVVESLRMPLEEKVVRISRSEGIYTFPADCVLVAAMNPCPCGYYPDKNKCRCTEYDINKYQSKINGPIMDRIDLCASTQAVDIFALKKDERPESSLEIKKRVEKAVKIQFERYSEKKNKFNAGLSNREVEKYCKITVNQNRIMEKAFNRINISARVYYKILKVARTIADIEGSEKICDEHLLEAIAFRLK